MAFPSLRVYVDWDNLASAVHDFTADSRANMSGKVSEPFTLQRGRSLDFSGDAQGNLTFQIPVGTPVGSFARQVLVTPGLLGCWPLGEATGTVAGDIAGPDKGAYSGSPTLGVAGPLTGDTSTAAAFTAASSQYMSVPYSAALHPGDVFTIAAWVKRAASGHLDIIASAGTGDFSLTIGADDKVRLTKEGGADVFVSTSAYADTNWHRYLVTKNGATTVVYRDGAAIAGTVTNQTIVAAAGALNFGRLVSAATYANATLAYVALWNRDLTAAEAAADYAAGTTAPVFPAYDLIGRGDTMLGRRVLVLADYLGDTNRPLFSGRIRRFQQDPVNLDITVTVQDDLTQMTNDIPTWWAFEGTFRELRMDVIRRMQTTVPTYSASKAWRNPNGGASRSWWDGVPVNRIANPGFETNTTGWNITTDAKVTSAAASITRTAGGKHGSWQANVVLNASASVISGIWYDLSAVTFKAGVTYRFSAWVKYNSVLNPVGAAIYSNGTIADIGSATTSSSNLWVNLTGNWTPTVDRNDVHFSVYALDVGGSLLIVDSCAVWVVDSNEGWLDLNYADPLCLSSAAKESAIARVVGTGPYGLGTYIKATAASNASLCMPFWAALDWTGGTPGGGGTAPALETFTQGQQYTATAWLSGNGTGKITLGKQSLPAGAVSSGTAALSGSWTQFHVSWTAPAGADSLDVVLVAETTSTQLNVGGVVVAQGATTWDWCPTVGMDGLDAAEDALHVCRITPSGRPLDVLKELNAASFSRHWCEPLATYPWWRYRTRVLSSLSGKSVAETYNDDLSGYTGDEQSYDSLINVVLIDTGGSYFNAGVYTHYDNSHSHFDMEDAASIALNGRITTAIASDYLELSTASVGDIGTYILANYAQQRRRFTITVENRWPSQLDRDLDDLIVLNIARLGIANGRFIIVGITHTISDTGRHWTTQYQLEQAPPT